MPNSCSNPDPMPEWAPKIAILRGLKCDFGLIFSDFGVWISRKIGRGGAGKIG